MNNPLAAFIQFLKGSSLSVTQIAEKTRYGEAWDVGSQSITARLDGGTPDLYVPVQNIRVEVKCYAESPLLASEILNEVITLSRTADREPVTVGTDTVVLYGFQQASGPSQLYDDDVKMDFAMMFFDVQVAE